MGKKKNDIITFKVDAALLEAMNGIENRSDFIRSAILAALDNTCPLCRGTGKLSPDQLRHWEHFATHHKLKECKDCNAFYLTCDQEKDDTPEAAHEHNHDHHLK